ncbi:helix-turn-helix domain-containing protein [Actinomadura sp. CNU-125]|uniref:helix-turn-helix domain-containing protein n=1 Tax=Actinomadura sp. CNU-125 TaxID=1904961 RepID=UPI0021CC90D4|nr:helix-turn-helix transcriptional regulator [Actinomadura sp. CNU-125]
MRELKRLRDASGLSLEVAAKRLDFSKSKLYRLENGRSRVSTDDLEDMLDLYDVRSPQREALIQLGRDARRRGWWTKYSDVFTGSYVGLESAAEKIRINAQLVPGFLQTEGYARAVIGRTRPALDDEEVERRVAARAARRQALLGRDDPPEIHVVMDESVVRRQVGGRDVMREQLAVLVEAGRLPNVTLQVLPFTYGAHAGVEGEFVILMFHEVEDSPVVYAEGLMGDFYLESEPELDTYQLAWAHMLEGALGPRESAALLRELHDQS